MTDTRIMELIERIPENTVNSFTEMSDESKLAIKSMVEANSAIIRKFPREIIDFYNLIHSEEQIMKGFEIFFAEFKKALDDDPQWIVVSKSLFLRIFRGKLSQLKHSDPYGCTKVIKDRLDEKRRKGVEYPIAIKSCGTTYSLIAYDKLTKYAESGKVRFHRYRRYDLLMMEFA